MLSTETKNTSLHQTTSTFFKAIPMINCFHSVATGIKGKQWERFLYEVVMGHAGHRLKKVKIDTSYCRINYNVTQTGIALYIVY